MVAIELIDEIVAAAGQIAAARGLDGEPLFPDSAESRLLRIVEASSYCLAIADVARRMRLTRQAAHKLIHRVLASGRIELLPNPDDARILQVFLTPQGRAYLAGRRLREGVWREALLIDLDDRRMAVVTQVLSVIRRRLERGASEHARLARERRERDRLSRDRFFR